jgi:hypothetical protein
MRRLAGTALIMFDGCILGGCAIKPLGNAEAGFAVETRWYLFHETEVLDEQQRAEFKIEFQALEDWLKSKAGPAPVLKPDSEPLPAPEVKPAVLEPANDVDSG